MTRRDHVDAALESTCDALITLRTVVALVSIEGEDEACLATGAIESVCLAIEHLRWATGTEPAALALGFVIERNCDPVASAASVPALSHGKHRRLDPARET
jgi:hypothetical protein